MVTATQKLQIQRVRPGSLEWFEMWRKVDAGEVKDYGLSVKTKPCPLCVPEFGCWRYIGTFHRSHSSVTSEYRRMVPEEYPFCHVFQHDKHPIAHRRVIRVVPASKGWEPEGGQ